jgi:hypothetical protein
MLFFIVVISHPLKCIYLRVYLLLLDLVALIPFDVACVFYNVLYNLNSKFILINNQHRVHT